MMKFENRMRIQTRLKIHQGCPDLVPFLCLFFLMLIFGGMILDKMGVRFTGMMSCILMLVGCAIKYAAVAGYIGTTGEILGFKAQVAYASLGYAIFGMGVEIAGIPCWPWP